MYPKLDVPLLMLAMLMFDLIPSSAQETAQRLQAGPEHAEHSHAAMQMQTGPHGGLLRMIGSRRVETVLLPKGIMFMLLERNGHPVATPDASGTMKLRVGNSAKEYLYHLRTLKNQAIGVGVDLSKVKGLELHMEVQLTNVGTEPLRFQVTGEVLSDWQSAR